MTTRDEVLTAEVCDLLNKARPDQIRALLRDILAQKAPPKLTHASTERLQ